MASTNDPREPAAPRQAFTFYGAHGRVYASNAAQKLVDLGVLVQQGPVWGYCLDGNRQAAAGFASAVGALQHLADNIRFLYLDGQFTALADLREGSAPVHLDGAARIDVMIDELRHGEPMEDARV